ncbi:MAG: N-6 DNA methylase [Clostridiales bacterium]|nr:N-6 DNA methylase [Clostridiales bacterium]
MNCYGITDDSSMTLAMLTAGKGCNIVSETSSYYNSVLSCMFLILASDGGKIEVLNNPVKWLPLGQEKKMGSFDRAYAFPPLGYKEEIRQIFDCQDDTPAHFIEWYPDNLKCGEWLYARHMVTALKPGGIGYILFPLGSYSRMSIYQRVRQTFIEQNLVDAVIEFPPGTISDTLVTSALMIIKKGREDKDIFMVNLGGNAGKELIQVKRGLIEHLETDKIAKIILARVTQDGLSKEVTPEEIKDNGYSFSPSAYVEEEVNLDELAEDYEKLMARDKGLRSRYEDACESYEAAIIQFDHVMKTMRGI